MIDNKFWAVVWGCITSIILAITISIAVYNINYNNISLEMVKNGVDPEAVQCALGDTWGQNPVCLVIASGK